MVTAVVVCCCVRVAECALVCRISCVESKEEHVSHVTGSFYIRIVVCVCTPIGQHKIALVGRPTRAFFVALVGRFMSPY